MTPTGVLGQAAIGMTHPGARSSLHTSILADTPVTAFVAGTERTLTLDGPFYMLGGFTLSDGRRYEETAHPPRGAPLRGRRSRALRGRRAPRIGLRALEDSLVTLGALDAIHERAAPVVLAR